MKKILACATAALLGMNVNAGIKSAAINGGKDVKGAQMVKDLIEKMGETPDVIIYGGVRRGRSNDTSRIYKEINAATDAQTVGLVGMEYFFVNQAGFQKNINMIVGLKATENTVIKTASMAYSTENEMADKSLSFGKQLKPSDGHNGMLLLLTDTISSHQFMRKTDAFCRGLQSGLGGKTPISGGNHFSVIYGSDFSKHQNVGIMISDPDSTANTVQETGKEYISPALEITKSERRDNVDYIVDLAGRPWAETYLQYTEKFTPKKELNNAIKGRFGGYGNKHPLVYSQGERRDFVRLSHRLGSKKDLEVECYDLKEGDKVYITRIAPNQFAKIEDGFKRVTHQSGNFTCLIPCSSNLKSVRNPRFVKTITKNLKPNSVLFGFIGTGEYCSLREKDFAQVGPLRYRQLSYVYGNIVTN